MADSATDIDVTIAEDGLSAAQEQVLIDHIVGAITIHGTIEDPAQAEQHLEVIDKMTSDLFSGSPTDNTRRFDILNQTMQGAGHTIFSQDGNSGSKSAQERKRRASNTVFQASLQGMLIQKQRLERELNELKVRHAEIMLDIGRVLNEANELRDQIRSLRNDNIQITSDLDSLKTEIEVMADDLERAILSTEEGRAAYSQFTRMRDTGKDYVTMQYDEMPGDHGANRQYIVWKDDNGQYYLRNPEDGSRVDIPQDDTRLLGVIAEEHGIQKARFGNPNSATDQETYEQFVEDYNAWFEFLLKTMMSGL